MNDLHSELMKLFLRVPVAFFPVILPGCSTKALISWLPVSPSVAECIHSLIYIFESSSAMPYVH